MKHYPSVMLTVTRPKDKVGNVKVEVSTNWARSDSIGTFYLPYTEDWDKPGVRNCELYKARIKHDFKVTFDHYSCLNK